jgi:hypothetical protein
MRLRRGLALVLVLGFAVSAFVARTGTSRATCDSSAFHLTVTDVNGNVATEPDGSSLPLHRLPDGAVAEAYFAKITITGGTPPYSTGYGGYSLPPGIDKSISSSPGTSNNDVVTISGSSSESYAASLILTVLDRNGCGPTPADSRFDWLYGQTPTETGPSPSIPDPITVGDQPSCDPGGWTGDANYPSITFSYEWRRDNADGTVTAVGSAQTYTTTPADGGLRLTCYVTATNQFGSTQAISNLVRVRYPPKNVNPPTLLVTTGRGVAPSDNRLSCDPGSWVGAPTISYSYVWIAHRVDGSSPVVSKSDAYVPGARDIGGQVDCTVTATNQDGVATATTGTFKVSAPVLVVTRVVALGWRNTGNLDWIADAGPLTAAEPQSDFMRGDSVLVSVTVENRGNLPSKPDELLIGALTNEPVNRTELTHAHFQPTGVINPGERVLTAVILKLSSPGLDRLTAAGKSVRALIRADVVGLRNIGGSEIEVPATVYGDPARLPPEDISNSGGAFNVAGELEPPVLPPAEALPPQPPRPTLDVALLQLGGGAQAARAHPPVCEWVSGASGSFARRAATRGRCATPIWLRARIHGHRWSFSLDHSLPRGTYVLYVRALDRLGLYDPVFTARKHTRVVFAVR